MDIADSTRVEVRRGKNESTSALIRRFTRRAQGLGLVRELRDKRYYKRTRSKNVGRKRALITLTRRAKYHELLKLGKIEPTQPRGRGGRPGSR